MIHFFFLMWALVPVYQRPATAGDFTPPNRVMVYRQIFICPTNSPVTIVANVFWFDRDGEIYFYKPLEIQYHGRK